MTTKSVLSFAEKIAANPVLLAQVRALDANDKGKSLAELTRMAAELGIEFSATELVADMEELGELELDAVVGGGSYLTASPQAVVSVVQLIRTAGCPCV